MGKLGAIISAVWFSYVSNKMIFILSAIWAIGGVITTVLWLPDTTGLNLSEYERMNACLLLGKFDDYHGEAVNPKHLSLWEIYVSGWHKNYNRELNAQQIESELKFDLAGPAFKEVAAPVPPPPRARSPRVSPEPSAAQVKTEEQP